MEIPPFLYHFTKHMPETDDITLITLKGHLLIEEILERIIRTVVAHGEELEDARLSFSQKVSLAKSMCWGKLDNDVWELIRAFNGLRNELAHQLDSPKVETKLKRLIALALNALPEEERRKSRAEDAQAEQLKHAAVFCAGFLIRFEEDAKSYRMMIDGAYKAGQSYREKHQNGE